MVYSHAGSLDIFYLWLQDLQHHVLKLSFSTLHPNCLWKIIPSFFHSDGLKKQYFPHFSNSNKSPLKYPPISNVLEINKPLPPSSPRLNRGFTVVLLAFGQLVPSCSRNAGLVSMTTHPQSSSALGLDL